MKTKKYSKKASLLLTTILILATFAFSQSGEPRQEKLLNGLKLLVWQNAKDPKISIKLRIHSGSAFDAKDKMGVTKLLSEILFPNNLTREFFEQDLEGSLSVTSNYDYIQIDASGKSEKFLDIIETLATAVTNPDISQENFLSVRKTMLEQVLEEQKNAAIVADQLVAKKLYGEYPYGRPQNGTPESLAKLDRIDLTIARDKFLTADNATLTISGNVNYALALKASKQFFGGWKKSDKLVPATFKQPDEPDMKGFINQIESEKVSELRYGIRGLARNDKDFYASKVLFAIIEDNIRTKTPQKCQINQTSWLLNGGIVFSFSNWNVGMVQVLGNSVSLPANFHDFVKENLKSEINQNAFENSKNQILTDKSKYSPADFWLDVNTYKLISVKDEMLRLNSVNIADVKRIAEKLSTNAVVISLTISKQVEQKTTN